MRDGGGFANEQDVMQDKELGQRNVRSKNLINEHETLLFCQKHLPDKKYPCEIFNMINRDMCKTAKMKEIQKRAVR